MLKSCQLEILESRLDCSSHLGVFLICSIIFMLWTKAHNPVLCLTDHLKKGARLELSLVHRLFNLGNNKNIKRIPVFLCYNRSTIEWKCWDSKTKPMTSERSKRVEEESMANRQGDGKSSRVNKRAAETDVRAKWRMKVEELAACGRAAEGNGGDLSVLTGIQMRLNSHQNNPANPINPQPPGKEGKLSYLQMGKMSGWIWRRSSNWQRAWLQKANGTGNTKSPC